MDLMGEKLGTLTQLGLRYPTSTLFPTSVPVIRLTAPVLLAKHAHMELSLVPTIFNEETETTSIKGLRTS